MRSVFLSCDIWRLREEVMTPFSNLRSLIWEVG